MSFAGGFLGLLRIAPGQAGAEEIALLGVQR